MPTKRGDLSLTATYDWLRVEPGGGEGVPSAACNPGNLLGVPPCLESLLLQWSPSWWFSCQLASVGSLC